DSKGLHCWNTHTSEHHHHHQHHHPQCNANMDKRNQQDYPSLFPPKVQWGKMQTNKHKQEEKSSPFLPAEQ
ncbi:hypothetical protein, partial [Salmonella sp. s60131]|uniref:hypothetical protein n=1 Tax=Salmonella sp. s60131 TaxID=3159722 RepID=UPI00397E97AB